MRYIGIDLAWGERNRTGLAELDSQGRLVRSASVHTDDDIASFLGEQSPGVVAAIDAPLIVRNETGQRWCEWAVGRLFGRYKSGAYPANRGNPAFNPETRGERIARRFAWGLDPTVLPRSDRRVAIEVYPHPAMVSLFGLKRVIPYKAKKGRDVRSRQLAFHELFSALEAAAGPRLRLDGSERWMYLCSQVDDATRQVELDRVEDEVDAVVCAYLAWLWVNTPSAMMVLGDIRRGYIVTPLPPTDDSDPHFTIDLATGSVTFGDGSTGVRIPRIGEIVNVDLYQSGGGAAGNVTPPSTASTTH